MLKRENIHEQKKRIPTDGGQGLSHNPFAALSCEGLPPVNVNGSVLDIEIFLTCPVGKTLRRLRTASPRQGGRKKSRNQKFNSSLLGS
jgi:hypothetical protein